MPLTRRHFLAASVAAPLGAAASAGASTPAETVTAQAAEVQIAPPEYRPTKVWAYDGKVPGRALRYRQGDEVDVRFVNGLMEPTTVHWHGQRLPNAMDGVPGMTQTPVKAGETFDYRFAARDAGTFWYHPHSNSLEQISRGLAGVLIVDEPEHPDVDRDEVIVLDDWRMTEDAQIHESFGHRHDLSHAGRLGNYVTANGRSELTYDVTPGQRLRLRLINTATARIFDLRLQGLRAWVVALDGMPLPVPVETSEIAIAPAQRVDLFVDVMTEAGGEAILASAERDGTYALAGFKVSGSASAARPAPDALPPNLLPTVNLDDARSVPLRMEGGAMRGLPDGAVWEGTRMDMRELAMMGQFWSFNGMAGMTDDPLVDAALGETVRIPMANDTAFPHAMHLHGMHFREIRGDGALGPWRDTLLINPGQTREIAFVAENPGDWMFHCHMLSHQKAGMMNWVRVS